jgi:signal transduction histidine kinase
VRYISHELRTPLNTAFLGLKLIIEELKGSDNPEDIERYDTLCDVNLSCMAAVDILNDLLCCEKLDSGILELHRQDVAVASFLSKCVDMFAVQAREGEVTITVTNDICLACQEVMGSNQEALPLLEHDTVSMDKFKVRVRVRISDRIQLRLMFP